MNEVETALVLKRAMRAYSYNSINENDGLGIFKGVDADGVTLKLKLEGNNLNFYPIVTATEASAKIMTETPKPEPIPERTIPPTRRSRKTDDEPSDNWGRSR